MYDFTPFRRRVRAGTLLAAFAMIAAGPLSASAAGAATSPAAVSASPAAKATAQDQLCIVTCGPPSITASWTLDTPPGQIPYSKEPGTVTVHGTGFTPGDTIDVYVQTAGGQYPLTATASKPSFFCDGRFGCSSLPGGVFTVSAPDVPCGRGSRTDQLATEADIRRWESAISHRLSTTGKLTVQLPVYCVVATRP